MAPWNLGAKTVAVQGGGPWSVMSAWGRDGSDGPSAVSFQDCPEEMKKYLNHQSLISSITGTG